MKTILIVFSIIACNIAFSQETTTVIEKDSIAVVVDEMAEFPGGRNALVNYLVKEINYPTKAIKKKLEGKVVLKFVVGKDGEVTSVSIVRGMANCPECEKEAIRVVKKMPKWTPAVKNGKFVPSYFILPIEFYL